MITQNNKETLDDIKKEIEKYIIYLLDEEYFQDMGFDASDEVWDFQWAIHELVGKYTSDIKSSVFCNDTIKFIISHNIFRECLEELKQLIGDRIPGESKFKNGSWVFPKKSWTPKIVAKKITKKVFLRTRYDQEQYSGIKIPTFCHEYNH